MNLRETLPIYLQIAERLKDEILAGLHKPDERVPGVRDYSVLLQVNVNTTAKAFDQLRQRAIIYDKRGLGSFVSPDATDIILNERREHFVKQQIPEIVRTLRQLDITPEQLTQEIIKYNTANPYYTSPTQDEL